MFVSYSWSVEKTTGVVGEIEALCPEREIEFVRDESAMQHGDVIMVMVGMRAPVDGTVLKGRSEVDRSFLTGESMPVAIARGAAVTAGDVNLSGPLTLEVGATGEDTTLRRMAAATTTTTRFFRT